MLKQKVTISVVIPLYNKRETIVETVQSVLDQTRAADEIIIVDDGSSDGGGQQLKALFGGQVRVVRQINAGVSAARNRGVSEATSEYVAFLDGDDLWSPHYLEEVQQLARHYPDCGLIGIRYQYIDTGGKFNNPTIRFGKNACRFGVLTNYFSIVANGDLPFTASTATLKKSLLATLNGFPVGEGMGEDQDVWARAALISDIAYSSKVLGFYNRAADNRACVNIPVDQECPFSQRLNNYAQDCTNKKLANDIVDYTAAHLRYLVKQNILSGRKAIAKKILSDPRCSRQPIKKIVLASMMLIYTIYQTVEKCSRLQPLSIFRDLRSNYLLKS